MSTWSNTIDELADPEAFMAQMSGRMDDREREWATGIARAIGEALFEDGKAQPWQYGNNDGFAGFTYWPDAVEALGLAEAVRCASDGWISAYDANEDDEDNG